MGETTEVPVAIMVRLLETAAQVTKNAFPIAGVPSHVAVPRALVEALESALLDPLREGDLSNRLDAAPEPIGPASPFRNHGYGSGEPIPSEVSPLTARFGGLEIEPE